MAFVNESWPRSDRWGPTCSACSRFPRDLAEAKTLSPDARPEPLAAIQDHGGQDEMLPAEVRIPNASDPLERFGCVSGEGNQEVAAAGEDPALEIAPQFALLKCYERADIRLGTEAAGQPRVASVGSEGAAVDEADYPEKERPRDLRGLSASAQKGTVPVGDSP